MISKGIFSQIEETEVVEETEAIEETEAAEGTSVKIEKEINEVKEWNMAAGNELHKQTHWMPGAPK